MSNRDWMEEVEGKRSLRWYRMVKEEADLEQYTRSICGAGEPEAAFETEDQLSGAYGRQEEVQDVC